MRLSVTQNVAEVLGLLPGQWCIVAPQERTGKQMRNNELPESLAWLPADGAGGEVPSSSRSPSSVKTPPRLWGRSHAPHCQGDRKPYRKVARYANLCSEFVQRA